MVHDFPLEVLRTYQPDLDEPEDFDQFWTATLQAERAQPGLASVVPVASPLTTLGVSDVTFPGFGGHPVKAWLIKPLDSTAPLACVVEFIGYGGGRGLPTERLLWASAGYAHLVMDNRGQAGSDTPDPGVGSRSPQVPGHLTDGLDDPATYYYRRLITDAVRLVDAAMTIPSIDASRILVAGISQGGGVALAVAGLHHGPVGLISDVPFLAHFQRAVTVASDGPYLELQRHLARRRGRDAEVFRVLSYFDAVNFAKRALAPALFSVGLFDAICPPSTVFAAVNRYSGSHELRIYPFNGHEASEGDHTAVRLDFAARWLKDSWTSGTGEGGSVSDSKSPRRGDG